MSDDLIATVNKAVTLLNLNRYEEVIDLLRDVLDLVPDALIFSATAYIGLFDFDRAKKLLEAVAQQSPLSPESLAEAAMCWLRIGEHDRAIPLLEDAASLAIPETGVGFALAANYLARKNPEEALRVVHQIRTAHPQNLMVEKYASDLEVSVKLVLNQEIKLDEDTIIPENFLNTVLWRWHEIFEQSADLQSHSPIFVVGDSHVQIFSGTLVQLPQMLEPMPRLFPWFLPIHIGPVLAWGLGRPKRRMRGRERLNWLIDSQLIPPGATIMLSAGEIDIRAHLEEQMSRQGRTAHEVIDQMVFPLLTTGSDLMERGYKVLYWAPIGAAHTTGSLLLSPISSAEAVRRNQHTRIFIERLRDVAETLGMPVLSIFDEIVDQHNNGDPRMFCDGLHLGMWSLPVIQKVFRNRFSVTVE